MRTSCFFQPWPLILTEASSKLTSSTKDCRESERASEKEAAEGGGREGESGGRGQLGRREKLTKSCRGPKTHVGTKCSSKLDSLVEQSLVQVTTVDHEGREAEALLQGSERSAPELLVVGVTTNRVTLETNGL